MATYESYKDSGVKWLGQIPSHWEVKKLRAFFSEVCESNSALKVHNQLQFKYGTIVPKPDTGVDDAVLKTISKYTVTYSGRYPFTFSGDIRSHSRWLMARS